MRTLRHNFNDIGGRKPEAEADTPKYPAPFSIRFTFEERARLDAERGKSSLAVHMGSSDCPNCPLNGFDREKLRRLIDAAHLSDLIDLMNEPEGIAPLIQMLNDERQDNELMQRVWDRIRSKTKKPDADQVQDVQQS